MKLLSLIVFLFCAFIMKAQSGVGYIFEELPNDSLHNNSVKNHSTIKPFIRQISTKKFASAIDENKQKSEFSIAPLADLNASYSDSFAARTGLGVVMELNTKKWYARATAIGGIGTQDAVFHTNSFYKEPHGSYYAYVDMRGRVSFTPNKIFNFQVGLDNNFIGEGNRSLFLSDYGSPYPFAQIRTRFWRVEYTVMYQFFREKFNSNYRSKYGAMHHISLNAAKWLNIGIFESVIFRSKDTLLNRGYDAEYLNPVIFYRPQEYSLGSSDNVLLGFSINTHWKENTIYSQLILDEFNLAEIRKKSGWWANKFGVQLGYKTRFQTSIGKFFCRLEYNLIRPYTYAHIDDVHNYGNQSTALAHPLGSNLHELIGEVKWQNKKWMAKAFISYTLQGLDKDTLNYGANIYQPYINRPDDYGNYIGQGLGVNKLSTILTVDYLVYSKSNLHVFLENHVNYLNTYNSIHYYPVIGIRSQLWNDYRNY